MAVTLPRINRLPSDDEKGTYDENDVDDEDEKEGQYVPDCPTSEICTNELCQRASDYFLSSLDFAVKPCDDFYNFTCGKLETSPVDNVMEQIRNFSKIILTAGKTKASNWGDVGGVLDRLKLPVLPSLVQDKKFSFDLSQSLALIKKTLDLDILFSFRVGPDFNQGKFVMIFEVQSHRLSSLTKFGKYLSNKEDNLYFREQMQRMLTYYISETSIDKAPLAEKALTNLGKTMDKLEQMIGSYSDPSSIELKCYTIAGFQRLISSDDDEVVHSKVENFWQKYVQTVFQDTGITIDSDQDEICATAVNTMWKEIDQAFIRRVRQAKWIDNATKKFIEDKVKNRITVVGYPDWLRNEDKLTQFYEGLGIEIMREEILLNVVNMTRAENIRNLKKLRSTAERVMTKSPLTVDVKYEQDSNVLMINMGFLQFPLYFFGQNQISYGILGSFVAGGILRGFDSTGMHHDKSGKPAEEATWWSPDDAKRFHIKKGCFIDQYDSYSVYGVNITSRGDATLDSNLADNGGLRMAYRAYKHHIKTNGCEPKLPGFKHITDSQLFFIAFAHYFCEAPPEDVKLFRKKFQHSDTPPNKIRMLKALKNSVEFGNAFDCPVGSEMRPGIKKTCKVW
ncbi:hypothetical protein GEV33_011390 [Tenebrio molitor]|uniref:Peptidase M13 C-terminal domain-containing protein n=1 Tax=Tenebrio molitor TaxID=7067 RepID=A0A8J6L8Z0_TENMO|nr:hypothetical protein GEV33_011390 [Tenebrio molitor]